MGRNLYGSCVFIGVVGYEASKNGVMAELKGSASETIIIQVATLLSQHGFLAIVGAGITLAGILAQVMPQIPSFLRHLLFLRAC